MKKIFLILAAVAMSHSISYAQGCLPEGITFSTQAQIDNFQLNYPGCTEIEGNVTIQGSNINNLNGLSILTSIGGNLTIGDLPYINLLSSLTGLENLNSVGGDLTISGNGNLSSVEALDNLTFVGGDLKLTGNILLSPCNTNWLCNYLSAPNGVVDIWGNADGCQNLIEVALACGGIPCLPYGNYSFSKQADIDNFQDAFPNCSSLQGNVPIYGSDIASLSGLNMLTSIEGDLSIKWTNALINLTGLDSLSTIGGSLIIGGESGGNQSLVNLAGLENLNSIGGDLIVVGNNLLTEITALESLTSIGGNLEVGGNALTTLTGLENITTIPGELFINSTQQLTSLNGLENLTSINSLRLQSNNAMTSLAGLENVTSIPGHIVLYYNHALTNLMGLHNITSIGEMFIVGYNNQLTSFSGLENLTSIGEYFWVMYNHSLITMSGLDNLTYLGVLSIYKNNSMTSLAGLENLTSLGGGISVNENNALISLMGIDNIVAGSIGYLSITDNEILATCEVQSVCDYLSAPNASSEIYNNAPGCNSPEEVEEACENLDIPELNTQQSTLNIQILPNPTNGVSSFGFRISGLEHVTLKIYDIHGRQVANVLDEKLPAGEHVVRYDMSGLPAGVYVVELRAEGVGRRAEGVGQRAVCKLVVGR